MRKAAFFLMFIGLAINSLAQKGSDTLAYTKCSDGTEYKIYPAPGGVKLMSGHFMELNVTAKCRDSLLFSTHEDAMPQYGLYDTANFPEPFKEVFKSVHIGDSIVVRTPADSLIARGQAAPFIHSGDYVYQYYVVLNQYTTKQQVDSAQQTHMAVAKAIADKKQKAQLQNILKVNAAQIAKDSKSIEGYLAKNKLKAVKAKLGTYVVIKKPGTGKKLTDGDIASVNYTGRSFSTNKTFDSNTDPKFQHVEPYDVDMSQLGGVILGWTDALGQMQKGTKATVYIPSSLAYGSQSPSPDIAADEILVFDMEVVKVKREGETDAPKEAAKVTPPVKKATPAKTKAIAKPKPKTTIKKAGQ